MNRLYAKGAVRAPARLEQVPTSLTWDDYREDLASRLGTRVVEVSLDDAAFGQACFCVSYFSIDEQGNYQGIQVERSSVQVSPCRGLPAVHALHCACTF